MNLTPDDLFAKIGRLTVENEALKKMLEASQAAVKRAEEVIAELKTAQAEKPAAPSPPPVMWDQYESPHGLRPLRDAVAAG